ncbi:MAG TPA: copper chaperone PCu(A)C [Acidimicrobiales bacterium]|nr:copper chaperone PCu(A)C [Acidimicrobiales bacterium]
MTPTATATATRRLTAVAALVLAGSLLAACGDDDDVAAVSGDASPVTEATDTTEAEEPAGELEVSDAWARTSPAVATAGAAYLDITNGTETDDVLVSASVDESVAAKVELHETTAVEDDGDAGMGEGSGGDMGEGATDTSMAGAPMMQMQPVEDIPVPAGESVSLEPGGLHIMMLDLAEPLEVGTTIEITLTFEQAGEVVVDAEVRDMAP